MANSRRRPTVQAIKLWWSQRRAPSPAIHTRCPSTALKARIHSIDFGRGATRQYRCILPRALRRRKRCAYEYAASMSSLATTSAVTARTDASRRSKRCAAMAHVLPLPNTRPFFALRLLLHSSTLWVIAI
ncbi:hypothetical protein BD311DRAFT_255227 [Dichomitus squalens]|uniref:Uncharacterized protein n=1 Tax=Dichomitus squalens TaxID=114155 RepID=A0A4Q9MTF1_9APHY|nr:hypothetical protein BD311DRAFT_255227 [Dichomitus squalens]